MELEEAIQILKSMQSYMEKDEDELKATETVLQALEEQEKEIVKYQLYLTEDVIPKKKIEEKIKKLESKIPKDINCANDYDLDNEINYKIAVLQELLEDK